MTLIDDVFTEKPAPKNMVREMTKKPSFRVLLDRQDSKLVEIMFQSE